MPRRRTGSSPWGERPRASLVSHVQFNVNWIWPAVKMQYERLIDRTQLPQDRLLYEYMQMVADMDFLVISLRRLMSTAELARQIRSEHQGELRLAINAFNSRWGNLTAVRNALEHSDGTGEFPVPMIGIPNSGVGDREFIFMWSGGPINLGQMYEAARSVTKAIFAVVESPEPGTEAAS